MENEVTKLSFKDKLFSARTKEALNRFFMSKWYPVVVAALVVAGHNLKIELYLCTIHAILFLLSMMCCESTRPFILTLCTFNWQVPLAHTPGGPVNSNYLVRFPNVVVFAVILLIILTGFGFMFARFKIFSGLSFKKTPLLLSSCIFSGALILNGAFAKSWEIRDLLYGGLLAVLFPLVFLVFYKGLKSEKNFEELGLYVAYAAAVMGVMHSLQMADLYIFGNDYYGTIFNEAGSVIKDRIHLGWATWNPAGICAAITIPAIFYGVIKGKRPWAYVLAACAAYASAMLTFSRNAMLMSTIAFAACVAISCFVGERKRKLVYRIVAVSMLTLVVFVAIVFFREIKTFAQDIFNRGFDDNGRFDVWLVAIKNFKKNPVFGTGFYYFHHPILYDFSALPLRAHQTFLELLSAMGFVGLLAYMYYRIDTAEMFFKKPTLLKTMLGLSVLVLLGGSMLDNFLFDIFPTFLYGIELAVVALIYESQKNEEALRIAEIKKSERAKRTGKSKRKKKK